MVERGALLAGARDPYIAAVLMSAVCFVPARAALIAGGVFNALARNDVFVPTLCHDDRLDPYGGCRMCVVGVEGSPRR